MKYLLLIAVWFLFIERVIAQGITYPVKSDSSIIKIREFYNGCGKIFNVRKSYLFPPNIKEVFIPTGLEILLAENLMAENYNNLVKSDERVKILIGTNYKENYYKYYRQYAGIIDSSGNKVIFIQLFKCCKNNIKTCFPLWEKEFITSLGEDPCSVTIRFIANIKQKKIGIP